MINSNLLQTPEIYEALLAFFDYKKYVPLHDLAITSHMAAVRSHSAHHHDLYLIQKAGGYRYKSMEVLGKDEPWFNYMSVGVLPKFLHYMHLSEILTFLPSRSQLNITSNNLLDVARAIQFFETTRYIESFYLNLPYALGEYSHFYIILTPAELLMYDEGYQLIGKVDFTNSKFSYVGRQATEFKNIVTFFRGSVFRLIKAVIPGILTPKKTPWFSVRYAKRFSQPWFSKPWDYLKSIWEPKVSVPNIIHLKKAYMEKYGLDPTNPKHYKAFRFKLIRVTNPFLIKWGFRQSAVKKNILYKSRKRIKAVEDLKKENYIIKNLNTLLLFKEINQFVKESFPLYKRHTRPDDSRMAPWNEYYYKTPHTFLYGNKDKPWIKTKLAMQLIDVTRFLAENFLDRKMPLMHLKSEKDHMDQFLDSAVRHKTTNIFLDRLFIYPSLKFMVKAKKNFLFGHNEEDRKMRKRLKRKIDKLMKFTGGYVDEIIVNYIAAHEKLFYERNPKSHKMNDLVLNKMFNLLCDKNESVLQPKLKREILELAVKFFKSTTPVWSRNKSYQEYHDFVKILTLDNVSIKTKRELIRRIAYIKSAKYYYIDLSEKFQKHDLMYKQAYVSKSMHRTTLKPFLKLLNVLEDLGIDNAELVKSLNDEKTDYISDRGFNAFRTKGELKKLHFTFRNELNKLYFEFKDIWNQLFVKKYLDESSNKYILEPRLKDRFGNPIWFLKDVSYFKQLPHLHQRILNAFRSMKYELQTNFHSFSGAYYLLKMTKNRMRLDENHLDPFFLPSKHNFFKRKLVKQSQWRWFRYHRRFRGGKQVSLYKKLRRIYLYRTTNINRTTAPLYYMSKVGLNYIPTSMNINEEDIAKYELFKNTRNYSKAGRGFIDNLSETALLLKLLKEHKQADLESSNWSIDEQLEFLEASLENNKIPYLPYEELSNEILNLVEEGQLLKDGLFGEENHLEPLKDAPGENFWFNLPKARALVENFYLTQGFDSEWTNFPLNKNWLNFYPVEDFLSLLGDRQRIDSKVALLKSLNESYPEISKDIIFYNILDREHNKNYTDFLKYYYGEGTFWPLMFTRHTNKFQPFLPMLENLLNETNNELLSSLAIKYPKDVNIDLSKDNWFYDMFNGLEEEDILFGNNKISDPNDFKIDMLSNYSRSDIILTDDDIYKPEMFFTKDFYNKQFLIEIMKDFSKWPYMFNNINVHTVSYKTSDIVNKVIKLYVRAKASGRYKIRSKYNWPMSYRSLLEQTRFNEIDQVLNKNERAVWIEAHPLISVEAANLMEENWVWCCIILDRIMTRGYYPKRLAFWRLKRNEVKSSEEVAKLWKKATLLLWSTHKLKHKPYNITEVEIDKTIFARLLYNNMPVLRHWSFISQIFSPMMGTLRDTPNWRKDFWVSLNKRASSNISAFWWIGFHKSVKSVGAMEKYVPLNLEEIYREAGRPLEERFSSWEGILPEHIEDFARKNWEEVVPLIKDLFDIGLLFKEWRPEGWEELISKDMKEFLPQQDNFEDWERFTSRDWERLTKSDVNSSLVNKNWMLNSTLKIDKIFKEFLLIFAKINKHEKLVFHDIKRVTVDGLLLPWNLPNTIQSLPGRDSRHAKLFILDIWAALHQGGCADLFPKLKLLFREREIKLITQWFSKERKPLIEDTVTSLDRKILIAKNIFKVNASLREVSVAKNSLLFKKKSVLKLNKEKISLLFKLVNKNKK